MRPSTAISTAEGRPVPRRRIPGSPAVLSIVGPASSQEEIRNGLAPTAKRHRRMEATETSSDRCRRSHPLLRRGVASYTYRVERAIRLPPERLWRTSRSGSRTSLPMTARTIETSTSPWGSLCRVDKNMLDVSGSESVTSAGERPNRLSWTIPLWTGGRSIWPQVESVSNHLVDKSRRQGTSQAITTTPASDRLRIPCGRSSVVIDWQENGSGQATPRLGQMVARG